MHTILGGVTDGETQGVFSFPVVLHTTARAYPGGVEEKGTGKGSKDHPVQIRKVLRLAETPDAEGIR